MRTYTELKECYKINHSGLKRYDTELHKYVDINPDDYDIIIQSLGPGYATARYHIIKRPDDISTEELASICDKGGYNFGHRLEGSVLIVYTD